MTIPVAADHTMTSKQVSYLFMWGPGSMIFSNVFIPVKQGGAVTEVTDGKLRLKDINF